MTEGGAVRRDRAWAAGFVVVVAALAASALAARVVAEGRRELAAAQTARALGDERSAIAHGRRSAAAWLPGAAHVVAAYAALGEIAREAESRQDTATALLAWHATRSAALASRWALPVHEGDRARADAAIARLAAAAPRTFGTETVRGEDLRAEVAAELAAPVGPSATTRLALVAGAAAWIGGGAWIARHGVGDGAWKGGALRVAGVVGAVGALAWLAGVLLG